MEPHTGLNNLDYIVLGIILLSGLLALMRGFVREVLSLAVWVGAYLIAARYYPLAEPTARHYIKSPSLATDVAAVSVFIIAFIVLSLISYLIAQLVQGRALTAIDRSLGFLFGLLRGALVVCLVYLIAVALIWPDIDKPPEPAPSVEAQTQNPAEAKEKDKNQPPQWLMQAKTRPFIAYGAAWLKNFVPEKQIEETTKQYMEQKASAQHVIDQKTLDVLSTPAVPGAHDDKAPSYDDKNRAGLNNLIEEKAKP
jgi:membrane protein required for colicin V production